MIAVFAMNQREFRCAQFFPKSFFKLITSEEKIMGCKFSGVIILSPHYTIPNNSLKALESLERRQPELFK